MKTLPITLENLMQLSKCRGCNGEGKVLKTVADMPFTDRDATKPCTQCEGIGAPVLDGNILQMIELLASEIQSLNTRLDEARF